eukprot:6290823-Prymnesium_polylepis.1
MQQRRRPSRFLNILNAARKVGVQRALEGIDILAGDGIAQKQEPLVAQEPHQIGHSFERVASPCESLESERCRRIRRDSGMPSST